jgi:hypothetical protein
MHRDITPLLRVPRWDASSVSEKLSLITLVTEQLGEEWAFEGLLQNSLGTRQHETARFRYRPDDSCFRLIPGTDGKLGYEPDSFVPGSEELASWEDSRISRDLSLEKHLSDVLTPVRRVTLLPMLVAELAIRIGQEPLAQRPDLPDFVLASCPPDKQWYRDRELTVADAESLALDTGFQLPTSDQWEYACAGNVRTLFRWGNEWAHDCYPNEAPRGPEACEAILERFGRFRPMTDQRREKIRKTFRWNHFNLHVQPNAFGLSIGQDPFDLEVCKEGVLRGGDGGNATSSDLYGFFAAWLTLASSFSQCRIPAKGQSGLYFRRFLPLKFD